MSKHRSKLVRKLLILLIVSAAFILARFSHVSAGEVDQASAVTAGEVQTVEADHPDAVAESGQNGLLPGSKLQQESLVGPMLKLLLALAAVVGGLYLFLMILRRMMGSKFSANKGHRLIETLETTYIAQKKSVSLIRYGEKAVLVGVTDGAISVLAELSREETDQILKATEADKREAGFKSVFAGARDKMKTFDLKKLSATWASHKADRPQEA